MFLKKPTIRRGSEKSLPKTYRHKSSSESACCQRRFEKSGKSRCKRAPTFNRTLRHKSHHLTAQSVTTKKLTERRRRRWKITSELMLTSTWAERRWKSNDTTWHWSARNRTMPKLNTPTSCRNPTSFKCRTINLHYRQYSTSSKNLTRSERRASKNSSSLRLMSSHKWHRLSRDASRESWKLQRESRRRRIRSKW